MNIHWRGPWPVIWTVWGFGRTLLIFLCALAAHANEGLLPHFWYVALFFWYVIFAILEGVGVWRLKYRPPDGVELIKTWSQLNQWLGARFGRWIRFVSVMNAAFDAGAVWVLLAPLSHVLAALMAFLLFRRLAPHFNVRSDLG